MATAFAALSNPATVALCSKRAADRVQPGPQKAARQLGLVPLGALGFAILAAFPVRLAHTRAEEIRTALAEINKIAWLRLQDLLKQN